jgi:hypothetical protein
MNRIVGGYFEIVEGDQIDPHKWDFGFNTWTMPVYCAVSSAHPDGPEGYRHSEWDRNKPIYQGFVESVDDAQRIVQAWTPDRRRRYLSQEPIYWSLWDWVYMRGWVTSNGRRKFRTVYDKHKTRGHCCGGSIAALVLTDKDFRHGITLNLLYQLRLYNLYGEHYELCRLEGYEFMRKPVFAQVAAAKAILSAPGVPKPVQDYFLDLEARCLQYATGENRLPEKIET